jgi:hypothetical protein
VEEPNKKDVEHLRMLAIFHFVSAGLALAGLAFLALHYSVMQAVFADPEMFKNVKGGPPPQEFFAFMKIFYAVGSIWFVLSGVSNLMSAIYMRRRTHRVFSMVVAGFNCLYMPLGTLLGVFTFVVLGRDSVIAMYEANERP